MAELGSHQLDAAGILIGAVHAKEGEQHHALPLTVTAIGGRSLFPVDRDCEDHVYCMFEFPGPGYYSDAKKRIIADPQKKIVVTYSSINGNGFGDYGEVVMGTQGTLVLERELEAMLFKATSTATKIQVDSDKGKAVLNTAESGGHAAPVGKAALEVGPISRGYTEELEHWAWCIKNPASGDKPRCYPAVALGDAVIALTTNQVVREGKEPRKEFKPEWFDIDSDDTPEGEKPNTSRDEYKVCGGGFQPPFLGPRLCLGPHGLRGSASRWTRRDVARSASTAEPCVQGVPRQSLGTRVSAEQVELWKNGRSGSSRASTRAWA